MPTLDLLPSGGRAIIEEVTGADSDATILRLLEMGLVVSTPVVVRRRAPWGDPIEVEVRGTRVVMRKEQARRFRVTVTT